jgi:hypothetical protein
MKPKWIQFLIELILILILMLGFLIFYSLGLDDVPDAAIKLQLLIISGIAIMLIVIELILCSSKFDSLPIMRDEEESQWPKRN